MRRTLVQESTIQNYPFISAKEQKKAPAEFCLECDFVGPRKKYRPGSPRMEVGLWFLFLVPGIINLLWKLPAVFPVLDDFSQMLAAQFPGVVRSIAALMSRYSAEAYGPDIENWVLFLIPGFFYSFGRLWARHEGCAKCGSSRIVSMASPYAQAYLSALTPRGSSQPWVCVKCASEVFAWGRVCPACGAELVKGNTHVGSA
jgi:hypothetical protein